MPEEQRWEYRVETVGGAFKGPQDDELELLLDEWGEDGWEVISIRNLESSHKVRLVAKRPLTLRARRRRSWPEN